MRERLPELSRGAMPAAAAERAEPHFDPTPQRFWGILTRRERWGLSTRGWFTVALVALAGVFGLGMAIYPFLALTHRVDADVLVVEGWISNNAIRAGADAITARFTQIYQHGTELILLRRPPECG